MKLRDTVILVVLAHVGLVLVWICMGGCANKAEKPKEPVAAVTPEKAATELPPTEVKTEEPPVRVEDTKVPSGVALPETAGPKPTPEPKETPTEPTVQEIKHVVKKGDTLWALSRKYKVPVSAIVDRNDIQDPAKIREGLELIIPVGAAPVEKPESKVETPPAEAPALAPGSEAVPVAQDAQTTVHKVEPGDTIWNIARKYNTTPEKIMQANNITDPTKLQVGQELRIPKGE